MQEITDEYMKQMSATAKPYTVVILKRGPAFKMPDAYPVVWEHGRRNYQLRAEGILSIVCPIPGDPEMAGIGIFNTDAEQTKEIMKDDPAVKENILVYEAYASKSFPGDSLP